MVVATGWGRAVGLEQQLLPSQLDGADWDVLDHESRGPQLTLSNYHIHECCTLIILCLVVHTSFRCITAVPI